MTGPVVTDEDRAVVVRTIEHLDPRRGWTSEIQDALGMMVATVRASGPVVTAAERESLSEVRAAICRAAEYIDQSATCACKGCKSEAASVRASLNNALALLDRQHLVIATALAAVRAEGDERHSVTRGYLMSTRDQRDALQARVTALEQENERLRELAMGRPY